MDGLAIDDAADGGFQFAGAVNSVRNLRNRAGDVDSPLGENRPNVIPSGLTIRRIVH
ncbi:hypothetical protein RE6C_05563 [Rhodopirellula europaea 6C]|uniref:Uncharacterized protein n=1 Tax=Rhodopirellula europaea 6C TaxID=1263867 RepID=M2AAU1_9BACT|nr:hypothetical protein RE6C_05563 [Rhodopirellula europaea 6C]